MGKAVLAQLIAFNQMYKEMDVVYHNYARGFGPVSYTHLPLYHIVKTVLKPFWWLWFGKIK